MYLPSPNKSTAALGFGGSAFFTVIGSGCLLGWEAVGFLVGEDEAAGCRQYYKD